MNVGTDLPPELPPMVWKVKVEEHFHHHCSNCGGINRLHPRLVVPQEKGGRRTVENSALLCFVCDSGLGDKWSGGNDRMLDFHVSRRVCDLVHSWEEKGVFSSMSSGLRELMRLFLESPSRFSDLASYQDPDPIGSKINFWVGREMYERFQRTVREDFRLTVKEALVGLILLHEELSNG